MTLHSSFHPTIHTMNCYHKKTHSQRGRLFTPKLISQYMIRACAIYVGKAVYARPNNSLTESHDIQEVKAMIPINSADTVTIYKSIYVNIYNPVRSGIAAITK